MDVEGIGVPVADVVVDAEDDEADADDNSGNDTGIDGIGGGDNAFRVG